MATDPPSAKYVAISEYCKSNNIPLLSGIDANAHHFVWGSTNTNSRGISLFEFIMTSELMVANVGNKPTFQNKLRSEVLDVTLCSKQLYMTGMSAMTF